MNKKKIAKNNRSYDNSLINDISLKRKNDNNYLNINNDIFQLIENNDLEKLKKLLNKDHSQINSINKDGFAPLHISVIKGNFNIMYILLLNGANPNILTLKKKQTPLHLAYIFLNSKSEEIIKCLKKFKANENKYDIENKRPIDYYLNNNNIINNLNNNNNEKVIFNNKRKKSCNKTKTKNNINNIDKNTGKTNNKKHMEANYKYINCSKKIFKIEGDIDTCDNDDDNDNDNSNEFNDSKATIKNNNYYQININKSKLKEYQRGFSSCNNTGNDNNLMTSLSDSLEENNKPKNNNKNKISKNNNNTKKNLSFNYPNLYDNIIKNDLNIKKSDIDDNRKISKNKSNKNINYNNEIKIDNAFKDIINKKRQSIKFRKSNSYFRVKKNTKDSSLIFSTNNNNCINNYNTDYNKSIENTNFVKLKDKNYLIKGNSITQNNTTSTTENQLKKVTVITNKDVVEFKYDDSFTEDNNNTNKRNSNNGIKNNNVVINTINTIINNTSYNVLNKDIMTDNFNKINNNKIKDSIILKSCEELKSWLENIGLSNYYQNFIENDIYNINVLVNQMKNPDIKLGYDSIESILKIHKPGHIYRLLCSLEIEAGLIEAKIAKFFIKKNKNKDKIHIFNKSNNKLKLSVSQEINSCVNCLRISFLTSKKKNDLNSFLNRYKIMNFYQNFYHNGFEFINFVILQMYSSEPIDKNILENCFHIYESDQRDIVMKCINEEINKINYFLNSNDYLDFELKDMIKYEDIIIEEDENDKMKIRNNNACTDCILF